jgi:zinc protease
MQKAARFLVAACLCAALVSCASRRSGQAEGRVPEVYKDFRWIATMEPLPGLRVHQYEHVKSGLKLLINNQAGSGVVAFVTAYDVGSRFETQGRTGLAHLFEHMMFRGTPSFPEPFKTLSGWGDQFNAWTNQDMTLYHELAPVELFPEVAKFEAERMRKLQLTETVFKTERGAVVSERKMRTEDSPFGRLYWEMNQLAFDKHPYRTGTIGWQEDLDRTSFQDALDFYKRFYAPNRATVVVVGDLSVEKVLKTIDAEYGSFESQPFQMPKLPQENLFRADRRLVLPMQAEAVYMGDAVFDGGLKSKNLAAESLLCTLLGNGSIGYLTYELVEKRIAKSVSASCADSVDPGLSGIFIVGNPGVKVAELEKKYNEALRGFPNWLDEKRLEGLKLYYMADQLETLREPMGIAEQLGIDITKTGDPVFGFAFLEQIRKVTLDDVHAAWKDWQRRSRTRVILEPAKKSAPFKKVVRQ